MNQGLPQLQDRVASLPSFAMHASYHYLSRLVDEIPIAIVILNHQGEVVFFNQQAPLLLPSLALGMQWVDLIHIEVIEHKCTYKAIYLRNGKYITLNTCPVDEGKSQALILTDITEEELLTAQLEHQSRLSDMGKMAGVLAHQIRTPLASAMLYIKNILAARNQQIHLTPEKEQQFLDKAASILDAMEEKIKDMLIFTKSQQICKTECKLAQIITQLQTIIEARRPVEITLTWDQTTYQQSLYCNVILLTDAIENCLENAINASANQIAVILIVENTNLEIIVRDNGSGISQELQQKVIEPFVTTKPNGTGLGLSVVKMIAEAHAGKFWLTSKENVGTEIHLKLPIVGGGSARNTAGIAH